MAVKWETIDTLPKSLKEDVLLFYPAELSRYGQRSHGVYVRIGRDDIPRRPTHWARLGPLPSVPVRTFEEVEALRKASK